ncbi:low temperature requirement protein A [Burkholderiaceae bacterium UC74_6]
MSEHLSTPILSWRRPMPARARDEHHRASTPLELMFDLVMVVAVAQAAASLHHGLAGGDQGGHVLEAVRLYFAAFFALWWAWMNFTWFASAYDNDDVPYRLLVFVLMVGALVFAAGVPDFARGDLRLPVAGYVLMRVAMIVLWLRAARHDERGRACARRYALGIFLCQCGWIALINLRQDLLWPGFTLLLLAELAVPVWAERKGETSWHPGHIAERYGLLTLIVLGEAVSSLSMGVAAAHEGGGWDAQRLATIGGGLLLLFSMWWIYFDRPSQHLLGHFRTAVMWGYGHYFVFGAAAAVGAGLAAQIEHPHEMVSARAVATGAAVYLGVMWGLFVAARCVPRHEFWLAPTAVVALLLCPVVGGAWSTPLAGAVLVVLLVIKAAFKARTIAA